MKYYAKTDEQVEEKRVEVSIKTTTDGVMLELNDRSIGRLKNDGTLVLFDGSVTEENGLKSGSNSDRIKVLNYSGQVLSA